MTEVNRKQDLITRFNEMEKRLQRLERGTKYDDESDAPPLPPNVQLNFGVRENKTDLEFRAIVTWDLVSPNTCQADVERWIIQIRPTDAAGNPIDNVSVDPKAHLKRETRVEQDPDESAFQAVFQHLQKPRTFYWQARVAIRDKAHRLGPFSAWTNPQKPFLAARPKPPVPDNVDLSFDTIGKTRYDRLRATVEWDEVGPWDLPDGDKQDDIAHYQVRLRISDSSGNPIDHKPLKRMVAARDQDNDTTCSISFEKNIQKSNYYQASVRSIDRFARKGDWSAWTTAQQATDNTAPAAPLNVVALGAYNRVAIDWDDPIDPNDPEMADADVAYYQAQCSRKADFSTTAKSAKIHASTRFGMDTQAYKINFWLRVRSVDASGNRSGWRSAGPVRPQKAQGSRVLVGGTTPKVADVEWTNDAGLELIGGGSNHGYLGSNTQYASARIECEDGNGTIVGRITASPTADRAKSGLCFRAVDNNNFLSVVIESTSLFDGLKLAKQVGGVSTQLTSNSFAIVPGATYEVMVVLNNNSITCYVDGAVALTHTLSAGDYSQFGNGVTAHGLYSTRTSTADDGKSRWEKFTFVNSAGNTIVEDTFEREANGSSLGVADSGQSWQTAQTWGIEAVDTASAVYGFASIIPIFFAQDTTPRSISAPDASSGTIRRQGRNGQDNNPLSFVLDRPAKIMVWGWTNVFNEHASLDYNVRFYLVIHDADTGTDYLGRQMNQWCVSNDESLQRARPISNGRSFVVTNASPSNRRTLEVYWGYRNDSGNSRAITVRNQKMMVLISYAPDYDASGVSTTKVPQWTSDALTRTNYTYAEGDDA
jgi:hypothetical protein